MMVAKLFFYAGFTTTQTSRRCATIPDEIEVTEYKG
ncbi:hypothetical protein FOC1_g10005686 [Fusarium oxysporum f. sp. cubense race 1]|uniref:Uncharacterized protein n=1 Tax=Fusarium oxysporum f. sp. cubense (strain race 1) TaxID=1229664 RepID=N4U0G1_FUSC1|nr:hypothetical protein FOC1_g10005686 [Fusarium oxysporum f. sp. cubense race 1]